MAGEGVPVFDEGLFAGLVERLGDRDWRLDHLYWIEDKYGKVVRFRRNWAQRELCRNMHCRNDVLKGRQLGVSTFTAIFFLDACLFRDNFHCGVIDKSLPDAQGKLGKIRFAWQCLDYLPPGASAEDVGLAEIGRRIKERSGIARGGAYRPEVDSGTRILWTNGSEVKVGTSLRGGTLQALHVSELAYVSVHHPKRAREIVTGAINTVAPGSLIIKESTHEGGKMGENYEITKAAMDSMGKGGQLSDLEWKFFFFPWYRQDEYEVEPEGVDVAPSRVRYFEELESRSGVVLSARKRAWYELTARTQRSAMKQEYPSIPEEAFQGGGDLAVYGAELCALREAGRVGREFEWERGRPLFASWDVGVSDSTSIWLWQVVGRDVLVLDYYEGNGRGASFFAGVMRQWESEYAPIAWNLLPHDAGHRSVNDGKTFVDHLAEAGVKNVRLVPRCASVWDGINLVRDGMSRWMVHKRCCESRMEGEDEFPSGLACLEGYKRYEPGGNGCLREEPVHDWASHGADAARMFWEAVDAGLVDVDGVECGSRKRSRREREGAGYGRRGVECGTEWVFIHSGRIFCRAVGLV